MSVLGRVVELQQEVDRLEAERKRNADRDAGTASLLALAEGLARIVRDFRLDAIDAGGIRIAKSQHAFDETAKPKSEDDEDVLFHSAEG